MGRQTRLIVASLSKLPPGASLFCHISLFGRERPFSKVALAFLPALLLGLIEVIRGLRPECLRRTALFSRCRCRYKSPVSCVFFQGDSAGYASERRSRTIPLDRGSPPGLHRPSRGRTARGCALASRRTGYQKQSRGRSRRSLCRSSRPHSGPHSPGLALHAPRTTAVRAPY